ncbi:MAG TPA: hypothetical protein VKE40_17500 [Gemmataceae bacterium]|nr:hypothetical protein [Gemmataceae bacterium]
MPTGSTEWPTFDSPPLRDIAAAFHRRRKAIAYKAELSCERELTETAAGALERFNLDLGRRHVRLSVWADGTLWFSICIPGKGPISGWAFKDRFYGTAKGISGGTLVGMLEATLAQPFGADPTAGRDQLREIWKRVGPRTG